MVNGLAQGRSAYLRQHGTNPVNWLPWGEAALSAAKTFLPANEEENTVDTLAASR